MRKTTYASPAIRWQLLSTVSAVALAASLYSAGEASAADKDADRPLIWLELGGQMESVSGQGGAFAPHFLSVYSTSDVLQKVTPVQAQRPSRFGFGEEGTISFQPEESDWVFSASARIGRSGNARHVHHQTYGTFFASYKYGVAPPYENVRGIDKFSDTHAQRQESHDIIDFSAGRDVGLGMLGQGSSSVLSAGVRFAQFTTSSKFDIRARPNLQFLDLNFPTFNISFHFPYFHTYHATGHAERGFDGVGPSLSWNGSAPVAGNSQDGEIALDWGINAAVLFGRQKAHVQQHESGHFVTAPGFVLRGGYYTAYPPRSGGHDTIRDVTVPNVGAMLGISFRKGDAKVSFGYRADLFMNAMDTGIDKRNSSNVLFHGPYASISIGLGD